MDIEKLEIKEMTSPEPYRCYIEFEGKWRASRIATTMIHAHMAIVVEPWPDNMYKIFFKKDVVHVVEKILKGEY
jgi:hypothetical protein